MVAVGRRVVAAAVAHMLVAGHRVADLVRPRTVQGGGVH